MRTMFHHTKKYIVWLLLFLSIIFTIGCSGTNTIVKEVSDGGTELGNPDNEIIVAGYAQKGPFQNSSTVFMYELDENFEQTGISFHDQTDEAGRFNIPSGLTEGYVELSINGYYFDEISYDPDDPNYLYSGDVETSALADVSENTVININILTSIAKETILALMDDGMTFDEANEQACVYVLDAFGITDDTNTLFEDMSILEEIDSEPQEGNKILLAVSAIMMQMAHDANDITGDSVEDSLNDLRSRISSDIADNYVLDDTDLLTAMDAARMSLELVNIRSHLENSFPDYRIPRFEEYIVGNLNIQWNGFNCGAHNISSIEVEIFDPETGLINDGPWPCNDQQGTVIGLNAGTYDTITINFMSPDNVVALNVVKTDVTVTARQTAILTVEPGDFINGAVSIQWNIDCPESGISTIEAEIYDSADTLVTTGGPWDCTDVLGTIGQISEIIGGKMILIFKDADSNTLCRSELSGLDIMLGQTTIIGPFILIPPEISSPVDVVRFYEGDTVDFIGAAFDYQGNPLTGTDLSWSSNLDGPIGTGESFSTTTLSIGTHTITLTAADSVLGDISTFIYLNINEIFLVGPGQAHTTIHSAKNAADEYDMIIVMDGTYTESLTINKPLTIISENGYSSTTVITADSFHHCFSIISDNVTLDGFTIYGAVSGMGIGAGVYLNSADSCTIVNNRCGYDASHNNEYGIWLEDSHNNVISNNICNAETYVGIELDYSNSNIISYNTCNANSISGIFLMGAADNQFFGNTLDANNIGIDFFGTIPVPHDNLFFLNNFSNTTTPVSPIEEFVEDNTWYLPVETDYEYNSTIYTGYLGNYFHDHDLTDSDGDGIADSAYRLPGDILIDPYPLTTTSDNYSVSFE